MAERRMAAVHAARAHLSDCADRRISTSPAAHASVASIIVPRTQPAEVMRRILTRHQQVRIIICRGFRLHSPREETVMGVVRRMVIAVAVLVAVLVLFVGGWLAGRSGIGSVVDPASLNDAERQFAERM